MFTSLIKLHPTTFYNLSQVMNLHVRHFYLFLLRIKIPSNFNYQNINLIWNTKNLKLCFIWTSLNWLHITWNTFLFFQFLPEYAFLSGKSFGISNFSRFSLMMTASYLMMEYIWYTQILEMISGQNKALNLICEYSYKLDVELLRAQVVHLLQLFNRQYRQLQLYLTSVFSGLGFFFLMLAYQFVKSYFTFHVNPWRVPVYIAAAAYSNIQGIVVHVFALVFVVHVSLMIKVFKCKLANCELELRQYLTSGSRVHFGKFNHAYIGLYRSLNMYNVFCCKFIYMCDLTCKLGGSITFGTFLVEGNLHTNQFGMTIAGLFGVSYLAIQLVYTVFAYFPEKNLAIYKTVAGLNAHELIDHYGGHFKVVVHNHSIYRENVRHSLRVNSMVQILANSQFGFTYSSHFLIHKMNVVENVFANIYLVVLFVKKFV